MKLDIHKEQTLRLNQRGVRNGEDFAALVAFQIDLRRGARHNVAAVVKTESDGDAICGGSIGGTTARHQFSVERVERTSLTVGRKAERGGADGGKKSGMTERHVSTQKETAVLTDDCQRLTEFDVGAGLHEQRFDEARHRSTDTARAGGTAESGNSGRCLAVTSAGFFHCAARDEILAEEFLSTLQRLLRRHQFGTGNTDRVTIAEP